MNPGPTAIRAHMLEGRPVKGRGESLPAWNG
jgi:hypothetical protein